MIQLQPIGFSEKQKRALAELCPQLKIELCERADIKLVAKQGDSLSVTQEGDSVTLSYRKPNDLFRALSFISDVIQSGTEIRENARFDTLCYMADDSRNSVMTVASNKRLIRYLALAGYDSLMLYTEDTFELPGYPYFGHMRGRYTEAELKEIDDYADLFGIEVIPCIQTLAHLATALRWPDFDGYKDTEHILMVGDERTYDFVTAVLRQCRRCFRSKRINLGMDEAHMLGRGEYLKRNGYRNPADIMLEHLSRVVDICRQFDFSPMIWSDMFFHMAFGKYNVYEGSIPQDVIDRVPPEVTLIYWDYYTMDPALARHMQDCHLQFSNNPIAFAGGAWRWSGFGAHNAFSLKSTKVQLDECEKSGIKTIIATAWATDGSEASQFSALASALYYAERNYAQAIDDKWLNMRALQCFDIAFDDLMAFDLADGLPEIQPDAVGHPMGVSRYLLYNDPLERLMDSHYNRENAARLFAENAEKLFALTTHPSFGYAFETLAKLCRILTLKCDLGSRLYDAYRANDRKAMQTIADEELPQIVEWLDDFILTFRRQWYTESKTFGLTTHDIRLGGLRERLLSAIYRIHSYLDGTFEKIEELEIKPLPIKKGQDGKYVHLYPWLPTVMPGVI